MQIQLIRNATLRFGYAGRCFITDPYLAARHTRPSFTGASPNPLVELPCTPQDALAGAEMALISHLHSDHFDPAAQHLLPKDLPLFCQPGDQAELVSRGFRCVRPVADSLEWEEITIVRTPCQHGSDAVLDEMGDASGFVLRAAGEPTVYWAGDTVWCPAVAGVVAQHRPQIVVTHSCGARWGAGVLIVMDAAQTVALCRAAPHSTVVAVHMEALDHATVSRADLRACADAGGVRPGQLLIPLDGETLVF